MKKWFAIGLLLILSACGGGGGSTSNTESNVSSAGIWQGSFHDNYTNQDYQLIGIVIGSGEARFVAPQGAYQYVGNVSASGNNLSGSLTGYSSSNGQPFETVSATGTVQAKSSISGTYDNHAGDTGTFSMSYNSWYDRQSSLSLLAANTWHGLTPWGYSMSATIDSNGNITGGDTSGCAYSGTASIIDPAHDAYRINVTLSGSSCTLNGNYTGLGILGDTSTANDTFIFNISNNNIAITDEVYK
ncbi:MAG: hypothetical protein M0Z48_06440 [Nitrospiraceae bacterium]|nr:hypothetical protein [Nitrospiraceae bacterium]